MRAIGETSSSSAMASSSEGVVSAHSPAESVFYAHMASGALAGAAEHTAMFPVDTIKTRMQAAAGGGGTYVDCLLYTSPSPRDKRQSRMPSSA